MPGRSDAGLRRGTREDENQLNAAFSLDGRIEICFLGFVLRSCSLGFGSRDYQRSSVKTVSLRH